MMRLKRATATVGAVGAFMVVTVPAASAGEGEPNVPPGMGTMHELMMNGNPGMARMHELMMDGAGKPMHPGR